MSSTKNKGQTSRLTVSAKICLILPFQSYHLPHPCFLFGLQTFLPVVLSANLCPLKSYPTCNAFMRVCGLNEAFKNATSYRKGCFFSSAENNLFHSSTPPRPTLPGPLPPLPSYSRSAPPRPPQGPHCKLEGRARLSASGVVRPRVVRPGVAADRSGTDPGSHCSVSAPSRVAVTDCPFPGLQFRRLAAPPGVVPGAEGESAASEKPLEPTHSRRWARAEPHLPGLRVPHSRDSRPGQQALRRQRGPPEGQSAREGRAKPGELCGVLGTGPTAVGTKIAVVGPRGRLAPRKR